MIWKATPLFLVALATSACTTLGEIAPKRVGQAVLRDSEARPVGTAQLLEAGNRLSLAIAVTGLEPGPHGFHLHTMGQCRIPDFASAGGHLNPYGKAHGSQATGGAHLGDLPNLVVASNRSATTEVDLPGEAAVILPQIFDSDGTALVIHSGPDDYVTDPAGNSGSRVACGTFEPG